jgi:hypothetical protein
MEVLVEAGLTTGKKKGIAPEKRAAVERLLKKRLVLQCPQCPNDGHRESVPADAPGDCETCGGSVNRGAMNRVWAALRRRGIQRLIVVGGGPGAHAELREHQPEDIELRIIPGDGNENEKSARTNIQWADLVVIWGGTILSHRVSRVYSDVRGAEREKIVSLQRRGVAALAQRILDYCDSAD